MPFLSGCVIVACVTAATTAPVLAQQMEDVVYLKNGSILRGTIIEHIPGQSLKIQVEGRILVHTMEEIANTTREPVAETVDTGTGTLGPAADRADQPQRRVGGFPRSCIPRGRVSGPCARGS